MTAFIHYKGIRSAKFQISFGKVGLVVSLVYVEIVRDLRCLGRGSPIRRRETSYKVGLNGWVTPG
jgi:hypothetical protein